MKWLDGVPEYSRAQGYARRLKRRIPAKDTLGNTIGERSEMVTEAERCWAVGVFELYDRLADLTPELIRAWKQEYLQSIRERDSVESESGL